MTDYDPRQTSGAPVHQQPLYYPPANYEPGDYPEGYYADHRPHNHSPSRYSSSARPRSDSGTAAGPPPMPVPHTQPSPGYAPHHTPQGHGSALAQSYFGHQPHQQQWYQPPHERNESPGFAPAGANTQMQRPSLHPQDAYAPRSDAYAAQGARLRARSDMDLRQPPAPYSPYRDPYSETDGEEEQRGDEREQRRRRRSGGSACSDSECRRPRERRRRKSSRKSSYDDKRPTLAESTIWAFNKAKQYVTSPY